MTGIYNSGRIRHFLLTILPDSFAVIAGFLFTLSFAPFNFAYLAPLALLILFASWHNISPIRALFRGYLFGLSSFGLGVSWVYISIHDFGAANVLVSSLLTGLFVAFWSIFPAVAGYISVKLNPKAGYVLSSSSIWLLIEYLRGHVVLNGFPWLLCAYSQLETPLSGYISVLGVYGVGFLIALTAACAASILQCKKQRLLLISMLIVIWGGGAFLLTIKWTYPIGDPIRVSLIQGSVSQDQKWLPENRLKTLQLYQTMTEAHWDSAIIIWPETAIPAFLSEVYENFLLPLSENAIQHKTDLIISVPVDNQLINEKYNAVITLGKENGMYRKSHLLPFGEYLPWQPVSGFILDKINLRLGIFTPGGTHQPLLKAAGYPFATSICYEDAFGAEAIQGLPEAAFLVNVTNDGWFGNSLEPHQHLQIARMRAIETGRYLLRATNTGATAIIDPDGRVVSLAPLFQATVLSDFMTSMGGMTPYGQIGDKPVILLILLLLVGACFRIKGLTRITG